MLIPAALTLGVDFGPARGQEAAPPPAGGDTFPTMEIARDDTEHEWPFSVPAGELTCIALDGESFVFFSEPWPEDAGGFGDMTLPRTVVVSTNPFALMVNLEDRSLLAPFADLETLIRRMGPFETMGRRLCEEEEGTERK